MKRFLVPAAMAMLVANGCGRHDEAGAPIPPEVTIVESPPISEPASAPPNMPAGTAVAMPEYEAPDLDGNTVRLSGKSDNVRLVNVWATWCGPCRHEIPDLIALQSAYRKDGLVVVGVSIDNEGSAEQIRQFVAARNVNYTIALDPDGRITELFSTAVVPTSALVDRDGMIVWMHKGLVQADSPELTEALKKAL